jgi:hypothetical protein
MIMTLTHWKKLDNPDYIGAYAFQPNEEKIVTIKKVRREMVTGAEGKREECTVVYFEENEKPLILNATNGKTIQKIAGTGYIEQWEGVRIALKVETVKAFGDVVDAVRVSKKKPPQITAPAAPVCTDCHQPITGYGKQNAQEFAAYAKSVFGAAVCYNCGMKRKSQADAQKEGES